ncbi:hypothetical protein KIPB_003171, partial [Kipferlia bialata]
TYKNDSSDTDSEMFMGRLDRMRTMGELSETPTRTVNITRTEVEADPWQPKAKAVVAPTERTESLLTTVGGDASKGAAKVTSGPKKEDTLDKLAKKGGLAARLAAKRKANMKK